MQDAYDEIDSFFVVLIGMIFLFATIRSGIRDGATLTLKVILSGLGFIALLLLLFALGGLFG